MCNFSGNLQKYRKEKGLSQWQLSKLAGISQTAISKYELDMIKPSIDIACKLADVLGVELTDLVY